MFRIPLNRTLLRSNQGRVCSHPKVSLTPAVEVSVEKRPMHKFHYPQIPMQVACTRIRHKHQHLLQELQYLQHQLLLFSRTLLWVVVHLLFLVRYSGNQLLLQPHHEAVQEEEEVLLVAYHHHFLHHHQEGEEEEVHHREVVHHRLYPTPRSLLL